MLVTVLFSFREFLSPFKDDTVRQGSCCDLIFPMRKVARGKRLTSYLTWRRAVGADSGPVLGKADPCAHSQRPASEVRGGTWMRKNPASQRK